MLIYQIAGDFSHLLHSHCYYAILGEAHEGNLACGVSDWERERFFNSFFRCVWKFVFDTTPLNYHSASGSFLKVRCLMESSQSMNCSYCYMNIHWAILHSEWLITLS